MFLIQTTITAGTVKASIAENKSPKTKPTYATDLSKLILNEATITKTAVVNKNSLVSLPVMLSIPTITPNKINNEVNAVCVPVLNLAELAIPKIIAKRIPITKE